MSSITLNRGCLSFSEASIVSISGLVEQLVARFYRDLDDRIEQIWADIGHWVGYL